MISRMDENQLEKLNKEFSVVPPLTKEEEEYS
jgi:hypothetical protein